MDLNFTDDELAFRSHIRQWVAANLPADISRKVHGAQGGEAEAALARLRSAIEAQYPRSRYPDVRRAIAEPLGHSALACPSRRAARQLADPLGGTASSLTQTSTSARHRAPSLRRDTHCVTKSSYNKTQAKVFAYNAGILHRPRTRTGETTTPHSFARQCATLGGPCSVRAEISSRRTQNHFQTPPSARTNQSFHPLRKYCA